MDDTGGQASGSPPLALAAEAAVAHARPLDAGGGRGLVGSAFLVTALGLVTNALNVVFHLVVARVLDPPEYALLTTMFAVQLVATVPLMALQTTVSRQMSLRYATGDRLGAAGVLRTALSAISRFGGALIVLAAVLAYPVILVLHVQRPLPILATTVAVLVAVPMPVGWAALQASGRFGALSGIQALGSVLKLAVGVGLAAIGFGAAAVTFGVAATLVATFVLALLALRPLRAVAAAAPGMPVRNVVTVYTLQAAAILGLQTALSQVDLMWARGGLPLHETGDYAAASVATSLILIIPLGVTTVLFPRVAGLADRARERTHLLWAVAGVAVLGAICVGFAALIPKPLLHLAFGTRYDGAAPWLAPLGIAMVLYSVVVVYVNHFLALGKTRCLIVLAGVFALQQGLFVALHSTGPQIITVQVICSATLLAACEVLDRWTRRREGAAVSEPVTPG